MPHVHITFLPILRIKKKYRTAGCFFLSTLLTDMRPLGPLTCDNKAGFVGCTSSHFSLFFWKSDFRAPWCSSPSGGSGCGTIVANIRGCFYMFPFACAIFPRAVSLVHSESCMILTWTNSFFWALGGFGFWMHELYLYIPYHRKQHLILMLAMALPVLTAVSHSEDSHINVVEVLPFWNVSYCFAF